MIFSTTPADVARAQIGAWQRNKELKFLADLEKLVVRHERTGLEKRRIARTIGLTAKALEKVG